MGDSALTILKGAIRFFSGTFLSRLSGLFREIVMAAAFGTQPEVAAFWMAYRFAHLFRRILGEGALNIAFIPHFEELKKKDSEEAAHFFYQLFTALIFIFLILFLIIEGGLAAFLFFGHLSTATEQVVRLTMLLFPLLFFISLYALNTAFLQSSGAFFLPSIAPGIVNLFWAIAALYFATLPIQKGMESLAIVLIAAFAAQWMITVPPAWKYWKALGWKGKKRGGSSMISIVKPFTFALLGVSATQINSGLDAIFARLADLEGPAVLWYAIRLAQLPLALFGISISTALLPPLSRAIQNGEEKNSSAFFEVAFRTTLGLMIPITFAFFSLGSSVINLLYGRGAFLQSSLAKTTNAFYAYSIGLAPMTLVLVCGCIFYAKKNMKTPTWISCCSIFCNICFNAFFVYVIKLGPVSIALSTSLSAFINLALLLYFSREKSILTFTFLKVLGASFFATCLTFLFKVIFFPNPYPSELKVQIVQFISLGSVFLLALLAGAFLFKAKEILDGIKQLSYKS